jgi:translation initiation factor IF-2
VVVAEPTIVAEEAAPVAEETAAPKGPKVGQVIDLSKVGQPPAPAPKVEEPKAEEPKAEEAKKAEGAEGEAESDEKKKRKRKGVIEVELNKAGGAPKLRGLTVLGKIDVAPKQDDRNKQRGRQKDAGTNRPTIGDAVKNRPNDARGPRPAGSTGTSSTPNFGPNARPGGTTTARADDRNKKKRGARGGREQFSSTDVNKAIRQTLSGMEDRGPGAGRSKVRARKRMEREEKEAIRQEEMARESSTLRLSEFVTTADLANLMRVTVSDIILKCMGLGLMVSINQRLDKETIELIASDYGFEVDFLDDQAEQDVEDIEDAEEDLVSRPPIVTIMGHVDHGKTSLLDYIRSANVVAGEAGGITQHIGAYQVEVPGGRHITFLDTPGHEAFTAMRARGAQVTDIVVIVVAADDSVMPQTIEAISHSQAANVPMVVAINKVDKPDANIDKIKQQLSDHGVLIEEWGGKTQCVELSAKTGLNVDQLLEKILLEADFLNLKANPDRTARATVIEAHVDKGRGNVVTVIVQKGTLNIGDIFVCGQFAGRVRAMTDERGNKVESAGPAMPVQVTGFDGLPNAGDVLIEMESDAEARDVATRRHQVRREQQFRGMRHMTLDDISAQIKQGGVKELRLIVKADVSGSLEALSDSLLKLSTPEVQVRIIYRAVGAVSESDVMLAAASNAIVVGFQVNVPTAMRKLAENESVDVRLYSIIYDCINEVQAALEGLLSPDIKEEITATVEVRALFKISKLGTIAGCYVQSGKINRNDKVRVLRDGFEIFKGTLQSLKRVKDDVREVDTGYECGININGFNDLSIGDIIEAYKTIEIKRKLA